MKAVHTPLRPPPRRRLRCSRAATSLLALGLAIGLTCAPTALPDLPGSHATQLLAVAPAGDWDWPLSPKPSVLRKFDPPKQKWLAGHRGVDLSASARQPVLAPADGEVWFQGFIADRPVISIRHANGVLTSYEPVESTLRKGDAVTRGQEIGTLWSAQSGTFHCATPCLHWGARLDGNYIDPLSLVTDRRPSVLLPFTGNPR